MVQSEDLENDYVIVENPTNGIDISSKIDKNTSGTDVESLNSYEIAVVSGYSKPDHQENEQIEPMVSWRKTIFGIIIVLCSGASVTASSQFGTSAYQSNFTSTSLANWLSRSSLMFTYPIISMVLSFFGHSHRDTFKEASLICGKDGFTFKAATIRTLPLAIITAGSTYCYYYALTFTSSTDVTAVFSSAAGFVYIFSLIWLKEPFNIFRLFAVILSIGGVAAIAYSEGLGSFGAIGVLLAAVSAILSGIFRVVAKKFLISPSVPQASLLLGLMGFYSMITLWIPTVILHVLNIESLSDGPFPWSFYGIIFFHVLFNLFLVVGIAVTYPIYASLGPLFAIPLNAAVDVGYRQESFNAFKILGTLFLTAGFVIMTIPLPIMLRFSAKLPSFITCQNTQKSDS